MTTITEMLPALKTLPRLEKLRLIQFLVVELAQEESLLADNSAYPIWTPYDAHDAAATLLKVLEGEQVHYAV